MGGQLKTLDIAFSKYYKEFMNLEIFNERFAPKNVQPGTESKLPVCPNYSLIEVCAKFVGIDANTLVNDEEFCGRKIERGEEDYGPRLRRDAMPFMACTRIRNDLTDMMYAATNDVTLPDENFYAALAIEIDQEKRQEMLKEALHKTKASNRKKQVLDQWRIAVYEISCIPPELHPPEEPHFQPRKMEDITDAKVISTVAMYLKSLEDNITGEGTDWRKGFISLNFHAQHCPQTP